MSDLVKWQGYYGVLAEPAEPKVDPQNTALLVIDLQYLDASRDYGMGATAKKLGVTENYAYYFGRVENVVVPNVQRLLAACRASGIPVLFVKIAALSNDLRDVGRLHRDLGLIAAPDSREAQILDEIAPLPGEIVISKTSSGPFNGTTIDAVLRNMGIEHLMMVGVGMQGCVETTVRDAADRGYDVSLISDGCAGFDPVYEELGLKWLSVNCCYVTTTAKVLDAIGVQ